MSIRRFASLLILVLLNLGFVFLYMQRFRNITLLNNVSYENLNSSQIESERCFGNTTNEIPAQIVYPEHAFPISYNFLLDPEDLCTKGTRVKSKLNLLVLVCSANSNFKQREAIRETWASVASANNNTGYIRMAFLLGATKDPLLQEKLKQEFSRYADIIQQDFLDSYQNLTLKSVMLLRWVTHHCSNVQYVLKTDDDMYVNVPNLLKALLRLPLKSNVMYGVLFRKAKPNRNPSAKWYVPRSQFEGDTFPDYLSGTGYVLSRDVVPKLLEASAIVPFLVMEDVFITGLCASECHVKRFNVRGFAYWKRPATGCAFKDVITGHHVSVRDMRKIWNELQKKQLICRFSRKKS